MPIVQPQRGDHWWLFWWLVLVAVRFALSSPTAALCTNWRRNTNGASIGVRTFLQSVQEVAQQTQAMKFDRSCGTDGGSSGV